MKVLLIDDLRNESFINHTHKVIVTKVARSFQEGVALLKSEKWDLVMLDHDLASFDDEGVELTGTHIMTFLLDNPEYRPKDILFVTNNYHGFQRMKSILERF